VAASVIATDVAARDGRDGGVPSRLYFSCRNRRRAGWEFSALAEGPRETRLFQTCRGSPVACPGLGLPQPRPAKEDRVAWNRGPAIIAPTGDLRPRQLHQPHARRDRGV